MKVAYLFHGHARTWEFCHKNFFHNIYSVLPGDIFIHTWGTTNTSLGSWWNGDGQKLQGDLLTKSEKIIDMNRIYEIYHPKTFMVEEDIGVSHLRERYNNSVHDTRLGAKNMLHGALKIFNAARNYDKYDLYFSTRLDILFLTKLDLSELSNNDMLVSHSRWDDVGDMIFDIWTIGNEDQFIKKTNYYNAIDEYWYNSGKNHFEYLYEHALKKYYDDNLLSTKPSEIKYCVPRIDGQITFWKDYNISNLNTFKLI